MCAHAVTFMMTYKPKTGILLWRKLLIVKTQILNRYSFLLFCMSLCFLSIAQRANDLSCPNQDSVFTSFLTSCDSITFSQTNEFQSLRDSIMVKLNFLDLLKSLPKEMQGKLSATDEFGLLTTYVNPNSTSPMHAFRTEGDLNLPLLGLPLQMSFRYSTFQNPIGVNNYVRLHFDPSLAKELALSKKNEALQKMNEAQSTIENQQKIAQGKLGMAEVYLLQQKEQLSNSSKWKESIDKQLKEIDAQIDHETSDSLRSQLELQKDSLEHKTELLEQQITSCQERLNKLKTLYEKLMAMYQLMLATKQEIEEKKNALQSLNMNDFAKTKLTKMDVGLCYPSFSGLSTNVTPMKGFQTEFTKGHWYYSIAGGVTLNNLMVSTNVIDNKLVNAQNFFNQFDYQNIKDQNWMSFIKSGYGEKEGSHAYVGFRYLTNSVKSGINDTLKIPGAGIEFDLQWKPLLHPNMKLSFIYGKTSVRNSLLDSTKYNTFSSLFSTARSNAALLTFTQKIPQLNSEIKWSTRWIDPFADNRNFGIVQSNNFRMELKTMTKLTSVLSIGLNVRRDQNNLMNTLDTTIYLSYYGCTVESQLFKHVHLSLNAAYLAQLSTIHNAPNQSRGNYIGSIQLSSPFELLNTPNVFQFVFSDYYITDQVSSGLFRSVQSSLNTKLKNGSNKFSLSYFEMNDPQLLMGHSTVISNDFTQTKRKVQWTAGMKYALNTQVGSTIGGKIEIKYELSKSLQLSFRAEKMVFGDFYQYYNQARFERFPYAFCSKINYLIK
jgi:hypothetical protein